MRRADLLIALAGVTLAIPQVAVAQSRNFNVPAGPLNRAIVAFGAQSGLTIALDDSRLGQRRTNGVKGRYSTREALRWLLSGTGATFEFVNTRTVRIVRAQPRRPARDAPASPPPASPPPPPSAPPPPPPIPIVVTASKQNILLDRYAGSVNVLDFDPDKNARNASRGTEAIIARLPLLTSTNLGPGRDKLFIRGVADSSFSGPTQATVGQYLGDARLTYNAPDPDLHIYDIGRVEVLAGPQGTLYGTGALGGIIRLVPNDPDASGFETSASIGVSTTRNGATSNDGAAMLNVPIVRDRLSLRAVAYRVLDGGYIDDPARDLDNINSSKTYGGRIGLRYQPGNGWIIDAGAVYQEIANRDGQYTLRGEPALTRRSAIAQPFDNDFRLTQFRIAKQWQSMELVSSTAFVRHQLSSKFDATEPSSAAEPRLFEDDVEVSMMAHETRLSGQRPGGEMWVAGIALIRDKELRERLLGDPTDPETISEVRSEFSEAALFGQFAFTLTPRLTATVGGRLTYSRRMGEALDVETVEEFEPNRDSLKALPSLALSWDVGAKTLAFLRYQEGVRAGGLSVVTDDGVPTAQRFESDTLEMIEAGFRHGTPGQDRIAASATLSYSRWSDIQADLVDTAGLPYTVNIGDGQIVGFDADVTWMPTDAASFEISAFLNRTSLKDPAPAFINADERKLPNVAELGGRVAASWRTDLSDTVSLTLDGSVRYVGSSQLGIGEPLDVTQGDYIGAALGGRLDLGQVGISVDVSNLGDVRANRFSFGNPFGLDARNQITPLRPRSIRIGIDARF